MASILNFFRSIWDWITSFFGWLLDVLMWIPQWIVSQFVDALLAVLNSLPVPSWLGSVDNAFSAIPPGVWWFASVIRLDFGLSIMGSAYLLRFVIRRLPFIG